MFNKFYATAIAATLTASAAFASSPQLDTQVDIILDDLGYENVDPAILSSEVKSYIYLRSNSDTTDYELREDLELILGGEPDFTQIVVIPAGSAHDDAGHDMMVLEDSAVKSVQDTLNQYGYENVDASTLKTSEMAEIYLAESGGDATEVQNVLRSIFES
ncbi:MAG: hypothetical protein VXY73_14040 [Pseudomonadota bacterium]|jgi:hypothetical protein|nr:hypothetical protein [Pseudomonadota bacterium]